MCVHIFKLLGCHSLENSLPFIKWYWNLGSRMFGHMWDVILDMCTTRYGLQYVVVRQWEHLEINHWHHPFECNLLSFQHHVFMDELHLTKRDAKNMSAITYLFYLPTCVPTLFLVFFNVQVFYLILIWNLNFKTWEGYKVNEKANGCWWI